MSPYDSVAPGAIGRATAYTRRLKSGTSRSSSTAADRSRGSPSSNATTSSITDWRVRWRLELRRAWKALLEALARDRVVGLRQLHAADAAVGVHAIPHRPIEVPKKLHQAKTRSSRGGGRPAANSSHLRGVCLAHRLRVKPAVEPHDLGLDRTVGVQPQPPVARRPLVHDTVLGPRKELRTR